MYFQTVSKIPTGFTSSIFRSKEKHFILPLPIISIQPQIIFISTRFYVIIRLIQIYKLKHANFMVYIISQRKRNKLIQRELQSNIILLHQQELTLAPLIYGSRKAYISGYVFNIYHTVFVLSLGFGSYSFSENFPMPRINWLNWLHD